VKWIEFNGVYGIYRKPWEKPMKKGGVPVKFPS
jgi:hypothetical protein